MEEGRDGIAGLRDLVAVFHIVSYDVTMLYDNLYPLMIYPCLLDPRKMYYLYPIGTERALLLISKRRALHWIVDVKFVQKGWE